MDECRLSIDKYQQNDFAMGSEHAIITDDEEIQRLFPSPLLSFGALEISSMRDSRGIVQKEPKTKVNKILTSGEGGIRDRLPLVVKGEAGGLLPDSMEHISNLERMLAQSRALRSSKPLTVEVEMGSVRFMEPVRDADDEQIPFVEKVLDRILRVVFHTVH